MSKPVQAYFLKVGVSLLLFGAAGALAAPPDETAALPEPWKSYKSLKRINSRPHRVDPDFAIRCTAPTPEEFEEEKAKYGPHLLELLNLYANEAAQAELMKQERKFPAGAVIVKESLNNKKEFVSLNGMQKMPPGYDPEGGDWKYFYSDGSGKFSEGKLDACRACHMRTPATDHVYSGGEAPRAHP
jgi:hypothetical protein